MAFSFSNSLATALDRVRFALGDTDETSALLQDETILAAIAARGEAGATSYLASGLATKLAYQPDSISVPGSISLSFSRVRALQTAAAGSGGGMRTTSRAAERDDELSAEYIRDGWESL